MKILFVLNDIKFYKSHFSHIGNKLLNHGHVLYVLTPNFEGYVDGIHYCKFELSRNGFSLINEIKYLFFLFIFFRKFRPDVVHSFTIKPVIYSNLIGFFFNRSIRFFSTITGLGTVFINNSFKVRFIRQLVKFFYSFIFKFSNTFLFFENHDDREFFVSNNFISTDKSLVVHGAGVDTNVFQSTSRCFDSTLNVIFVGRLLKDKGILEFLGSAVKLKDYDIIFNVVGDCDIDNISSLSQHDIDYYNKYNNINFLGFQHDISLLYSNSHIACLPSYREGLPKSLIEAASCGLPIITTNSVGCREMVPSLDFGIIAEPHSVTSLTNAILFAYNNRDLLPDMSINNRMRALDIFSEDVIFYVYYESYNTRL